MVILEVGLGGRLDATNIVDADIAAITSIALDHTDWLGADREHIGHEKAGIFRANHYAVVGEPDMPHSIAQVANENTLSFSVEERIGLLLLKVSTGIGVVLTVNLMRYQSLIFR